MITVALNNHILICSFSVDKLQNEKTCKQVLNFLSPLKESYPIFLIHKIQIQKFLPWSFKRFLQSVTKIIAWFKPINTPKLNIFIQEDERFRLSLQTRNRFRLRPFEKFWLQLLGSFGKTDPMVTLNLKPSVILLPTFLILPQHFCFSTEEKWMRPKLKHPKVIQVTTIFSNLAIKGLDCASTMFKCSSRGTSKAFTVEYIIRIIIVLLLLKFIKKFSYSTNSQSNEF